MSGQRIKPQFHYFEFNTKNRVFIVYDHLTLMQNSIVYLSTDNFRKFGSLKNLQQSIFISTTIYRAISRLQVLYLSLLLEFTLCPPCPHKFCSGCSVTKIQLTPST